jgi:hypothetical protein
MSTSSEATLAFEEDYNGELDTDGLPNGKGHFKFKDGDAIDRKIYEGEWIQGQMTGQGQMSFVSGDVYDGSFLDGVPHGPGRFTYASGDVSSKSCSAFYWGFY